MEVEGAGGGGFILLLKKEILTRGRRRRRKRMDFDETGEKFVSCERGGRIVERIFQGHQFGTKEAGRDTGTSGYLG